MQKINLTRNVLTVLSNVFRCFLVLCVEEWRLKYMILWCASRMCFGASVIFVTILIVEINKPRF